MTAFNQNFDATPEFVKRIRNLQKIAEKQKDRPKLKEKTNDELYHTRELFGWYLTDALARKYPNEYIECVYIDDIVKLLRNLPEDPTRDIALELLKKERMPSDSFRRTSNSQDNQGKPNS